MKMLPFLAALAVLAGPAFAAPQFSSLYSFPPNKARDTSYPAAALTPGPNGVFYGTTSGAGWKKDYGTVFALIPPGTPGAQWTRQTIYRFRAGAEGGRPFSRVIFDQSTGALLGTTSGAEGGGDYGAVYRLVPPAQDGDPWTLQIVHSFGGKDDGGHPYPGLVQDPATGAVYGATTFYPGSYGTLYSFMPDASHQNWTRVLSYVFPGAPNGGDNPLTDLMLNGGILYGATIQGGIVTDACPWGCGTLFSYDLANSTFTTRFEPNGAPEPYSFGAGTPLLGDAATLIGTSGKGADENCKLDMCGTVFTMPLDGGAAPTIIAALTGAKSGHINSGVIWNTDHTALYGTADYALPGHCHYYFGKDGCGSVFELKRKKNGTWKFSLVHAFDGDDGALPNQLVFGPDGALYGTTSEGGANRTGTAFRIDP
jgi:uncharacterized repeat protein (TIGR03803 family)